MSYTPSMGQTNTLITAEQLLETAGSRRLELVQGELVEMSPVGRDHSYITLRLGSWILSFVRERKLGMAGTERGFILSRNPDVVRAPDIHFVAADRLRPGDPEGFFSGAPGLAVEVASSWDKAGEVHEKIVEYRAAGARLVWLVDPECQTVTAYHPSGEARVYAGEEAVSGEDVLPGFSFRPADLFKMD